MRTILLVVILVSGCGGDDSYKKPDASVHAYFSECGHPGEMGNELGTANSVQRPVQCGESRSASGSSLEARNTLAETAKGSTTCDRRKA